MAKITFNNKNSIFYSDLKKEVDLHFRKTQIQKTGNWKLYIKTVVLIPAAIIIYFSLLYFSFPVAINILLSGLMGCILASIGFNVMHDACHGSYSKRKWVNDLFSLTMNALGSNAFIWKQKHNVIHHTYTNVDGVDDDIAKSPLLRECESQRWVPAHRIQHIYLFFVYSISSIAWTLLTDFIKYFSKKIIHTDLQKMSVKEHFIFWGSKVICLFFYIVLPILLKGGIFWVLFYFPMHVMLGLTLSTTFQLAHVVEHTEFEAATLDPKVIETEWAVHQIKTTSNFAMRNKFISWFVGGLNFQIEHHLFPRISHVHYPALSKIVKNVCEKHKIPYNYFPTMTSAIASHVRYMKQMGRRPRFTLAVNG
jgi:linoleoyl-CoA desaturase